MPNKSLLPFFLATAFFETKKRRSATRAEFREYIGPKLSLNGNQCDTILDELLAAKVIRLEGKGKGRITPFLP